MPLSEIFLTEFAAAQESERIESGYTSPQHENTALSETEDSKVIGEDEPQDTIESADSISLPPITENTDGTKNFEQDENMPLQERIDGFLEIMEAQEDEVINIWVTYRIDGVENSSTIEAGNIKEKIRDVGPNTFFNKAIVKDDQIEVEIAYITQFNGHIYFSFEENPDVGILLKGNQDIVLIYESIYDITYEFIGGTGSVGSSPTKVRFGENLLFQVIPENGSRILKVEYKTPYITDPITVTLDAYNTTQIPVSSNITVMITVENNINFTLSEGPGTISNGYICPNCTYEENYGGSSTARSLSDLELVPNEPYSFIIWTDNNDHTWHLNNLVINKQDIPIPSEYVAGSTKTTEFEDGTTITVTCVSTPNSSDPRDPHSGGSWINPSPRKWKYKVDISSVKTDLVVEGNFKDAKIAELVIKGKHGIERTGLAKERRPPLSINRNIYYSVEASASYNVHETYTETGDRYSINLLTYKTLAGYNPWTVSVVGQGTGERERLDPLDPDSVIFETTAENMNKIEPQFRKWNEFLVDTQNMNLTHAFYYGPANDKDQWVYLNASPYKYKMQFDLNGGTVTDTPQGYSKEGDFLVRDKRCTVEDREVFHTIKEIPKQTGYVFAGWKLKTSEDSTIFRSNARFELTPEALELAQGDAKSSDDGMSYTFVAQWAKTSLGEKKTPIFIRYYVMNSNSKDPNSGKYSYEEQTEQYTVTSGIEGNSVGYLKRWSPGEGYVLNQEKSTTTIAQLYEEGAPGYEDNNTLSYYYDALTSYTVHYYKIGSTISVAESTTLHDKPVGSIVTEAPIDITGYSTKESEKNLELEVSENQFIFYYTPHTYLVRFNSNGGSGDMGDMLLTYGEETPLSENQFINARYQFTGWSLQEDGEPVYQDTASVINLTSEDNDTIDLYAVWEYKIDVKVPLYVCMYGYGGDGSVRVPNNYGITNYSLCDIQVDSLTIKNNWTLLSSAEIGNNRRLKAGELYMTLMGNPIKAGTTNISYNSDWKISKDTLDGDGSFRKIGVTARIAGGASNETDEHHIVDVSYTVRKSE